MLKSSGSTIVTRLLIDNPTIVRIGGGFYQLSVFVTRSMIDLQTLGPCHPATRAKLEKALEDLERNAHRTRCIKPQA